MYLGMYHLKTRVKQSFVQLGIVFIGGYVALSPLATVKAQDNDTENSADITSAQGDSNSVDQQSPEPLEAYNTVILAELDNAINQVNTSLSSSGVFAAEAVRYYFTRLALVDGRIEQVPENFIIDVPFSVCPIILRKNNRYLVKLQLNAEQQYDKFFVVSSCQNFELQAEPESHAATPQS